MSAVQPNKYAIYLRKSRADLEAESRGEGETLARHRIALTQLAERRGLNVVHTYEEIVSGESIQSRPQMRMLLAAIEAGEYAGVIVNDVDRLTRGDSIDQGTVKQAFYSTGTLIITPVKTFDPSDEADEDFFDISLFFTRYEYRKINKRMQTGRARSAAEGNTLGSRVTYGFNKVKRTDRKGYTLVPDPEKAEIVRMIFRWYADGENGVPMGADLIARRLNDMGLRTSLNVLFTGGGIRSMLKNPAYIGTASWNKRVKRVRVIDGVRTVVRENNPEPIIVEGAHEAIVDRALWDRVQKMFSTHAKLPKNTDAPVSNVLAGLIKCSICGKSMQRKPGVFGRPDAILCKTYGCPTTGIYIPLLEDALLDALRGWLVQYSNPESKPARESGASSAAAALKKQLDALDSQMSRLHDLLEQGIYTPSVFIQRRDELTCRIASVNAELSRLETTPTPEEIIVMQLPQIRHVLESYPLTTDLAERNQLLRSVISYVSYSKTRICYRNDNPTDYMSIDIYPAIPSTNR